MKKKMFGRLGAAAVALTLITTAMMSGTLAKYTNSYSGKVKVDAAAWSFTAKSGSTELTTNTTLSLGTTTTNGIEEGKIAPGSKGSFDVAVDNSGSEVSAEYKINITAATTDSKKLIEALQFSTDGGASWKSFDNITTAGVLDSGTLKGKSGTEAENKKTVTIDWRWQEGSADVVANTTAGADNSYSGGTTELTVTVTGTQVAPTAETSAP